MPALSPNRLISKFAGHTVVRQDQVSVIPKEVPFESAALVACGVMTGIGAALNDQSLIAGIGNVIRIEACFAAAVSPWRKVGRLEGEEAAQIVTSCRRVMSEAVRTGRRPKRIYGAERKPCPRCGARIQRRRQGDDARTTSSCPGCQG